MHMTNPAPHHQDKQSTMNERLTSAPKASAPNLNSVSSSDAGLLLDSTLSQRSNRNAVHRVLHEDESHIRRRHAQHNLAVLLRLPHNPPAQRVSSVQTGIAARRSQDSGKADYLLNVLSHQDAYALPISPTRSPARPHIGYNQLSQLSPRTAAGQHDSCAHNIGSK